MPRHRGPRRRTAPQPGARTIGVHLWPDALEALAAYADANDLHLSGAAHTLLRQALDLPPTNNTSNHE
jgi:hypothetical protein